MEHSFGIAHKGSPSFRTVLWHQCSQSEPADVSRRGRHTEVSIRRTPSLKPDFTSCRSRTLFRESFTSIRRPANVWQRLGGSRADAWLDIHNVFSKRWAADTKRTARRDTHASVESQNGSVAASVLMNSQSTSINSWEALFLLERTCRADPAAAKSPRSGLATWLHWIFRRVGGSSSRYGRLIPARILNSPPLMMDTTDRHHPASILHGIRAAPGGLLLEAINNFSLFFFSSQTPNERNKKCSGSGYELSTLGHEIWTTRHGKRQKVKPGNGRVFLVSPMAESGRQWKK